jgi:hypothetical protein
MNGGHDCYNSRIVAEVSPPLRKCWIFKLLCRPDTSATISNNVAGVSNVVDPSSPMLVSRIASRSLWTETLVGTVVLRLLQRPCRQFRLAHSCQHLFLRDAEKNQ